MDSYVRKSNIFESEERRNKMQFVDFLLKGGRMCWDTLKQVYFHS